ncbi:winged helix-turn-helix domain-containing protein [Pseudomonas alloputida]|uniref:winged helix-turn-helix domain-containing protein n=1 Tax=Pseudomonas TaxID=286 RepID=UPI003EE8A2A2
MTSHSSYVYSDSESLEIASACGAVLSVDVRQHVVHINDQRLLLKPTPCRLMALLVRHRGEVVSRKVIFNDVWGYDFDPGTKIIDVQVCYLRKFLAAMRAPFEIKTHRGKGICISYVSARNCLAPEI